MFTALLLAATLQLPDARIEQAMRDTDTPELAVAVVQNDRVVYRRTFNADANTRFYLASAPKPMTALAAKLLSHEKKLDLDAPLTTTLPQLKLPLPLDPARMSVRDLLTHRLGFENDGVAFRASYSGDWTDEQMFAILEHHSVPTQRQFSYDNLGYMLASYAIERAAAEPWPAALRRLVLDPLEMQHTSDAPCIPTKSAKTMNRGSGGLCSTLDDMTRWLRVNMSDGMLDGKRIFPLAAMREVHAPQINLDRKFGRLQRYAYGLGWYHADYEGDLVIHHFGSYAGGAWAHVSWMPDRGIGVVALANTFGALPDSAAYLAYDTLLGRADAQKRFDEDVQRQRLRLEGVPQRLADLEKKIAAEAHDSDRALSSYAGTYVSDSHGTMIITNDLRATIGDRSAQLTRVRGDEFLVRWFPRDGPDRVTFGSDGLTWEGRTMKRQPLSRPAATLSPQAGRGATTLHRPSPLGEGRRWPKAG